MIARIWIGATRERDSESYLDYLNRTGVRECRSTAGNRGVFVLRRVEEGRAEFLFLSLWESWQAIESFAGKDRDRAVYYEEDAAFLLEMEPRVRHYEVAAASPGVAEAAC